MSNYVELPVEDIELDISNPRIARGLHITIQLQVK